MAREALALPEEFKQLVKRCLAGNQIACRELVNRYQGQVYGLCYRMLGQREDAEDAVQETFVRVLRNLHRWDPEQRFEPWLFTIAGNRCRTRLAKRMRTPNSQTLEQPIEDNAHLEIAAQHLAEEVHRALQNVRDEYRQAFVLFHQHEMAYAEIAESMGVPLGTIKTWVHRARREIIKQLASRGVVQESNCELRKV